MSPARERAELRREDVGELLFRQATELSALRARTVEHAGLDLLGRHLARLGRGCERLDGRTDRGLEVPAGLIAVPQHVAELLGVTAHRDVALLVGDRAVEQDVKD